VEREYGHRERVPRRQWCGGAARSTQLAAGSRCHTQFGQQGTGIGVAVVQLRLDVLDVAEVERGRGFVQPIGGIPRVTRFGVHLQGYLPIGCRLGQLPLFGHDGCYFRFGAIL